MERRIISESSATSTVWGMVASASHEVDHVGPKTNDITRDRSIRSHQGRTPLDRDRWNMCFYEGSRLGTLYH